MCIKKSTFLYKQKMTIPFVKEKGETLKEVMEERFWQTPNVLSFERIRTEIRDIMKFAKGDKVPPIFTNITDEEQGRTEGKKVDRPEDFKDYNIESKQVYRRTQEPYCNRKIT
ncbi:hypothetical protein LQZ18_16635 [Lachnospiraceae bacterium ZAX-1]